MRRRARIDGTPRGHKYGAVRTTLDGVTFASKAEARRYAELRLLERAKEITYLELQPRYPIHSLRGEKVAEYWADFRYRDRSGALIIEDVKSGPTKTPAYALKRKLVESEYQIRIQEISK